MPTLQVRFGHASHPDQVLCESIQGILDAHNSMAMATVTPTGQSYINTIHYGYDNRLNFFVLTQPFTQHSQNVAANPSVSVAIWNEPQVWGTDLKGLQLFGNCERVKEAELQHAIDAFTQHIPAFGDVFKTPADTEKSESKLYVIHTVGVKILDEPRFGRRNYLTAEILNA